MGEVEKILPTALKAAETLLSKIPELKVVIPAANDRAYRAISSCVARLKSTSVVVQRGGAREALRQADAAIVASGTATLEAALVGCPTVLVYRVGWFFAAIARCVIRGVRHVGLANIIAEKMGGPCPMPELLQGDFTVENVVRHVLSWLTDEAANAAARQALADTMKLLRSEGRAIDRIAAVVHGADLRG